MLLPLLCLGLFSCGGAKTFVVNVDETKCDHLLFTTMDGKNLSTVKAVQGREFNFKMKSFNDTSNIEYIVPTMINIVINDMEPLLDGYRIENISDTEANVTIDANKVIGNIVISGKASVKGIYHYETPYHYGLEEVPSGDIDTHENLSITFTPTSKDSNEEYQKPEAENIYILFDNCPVGEKKQWVSPAETFETIDEYCSYDNSTGELTIKPNHINSNIVIVARAHDYPLLEKLNWEDIEKVSFSGAAEYIFYLNEQKTVKVNDLNHKVRIIGFNHDDLASGTGKAGITFEFVNVICDSNGPMTSVWDVKGNSTNFPDSTLNTLLNNEIISKLENKLQKFIKPVNKKVGIGVSQKDDQLKIYETKLFPLAHHEMLSHLDGEPVAKEGDIYAYYLTDKPNYYKYDLKNRQTDYWLRSPNILYDPQALIIYSQDSTQRKNRGIISGALTTTPHCFAPAFCI